MPEFLHFIVHCYYYFFFLSVGSFVVSCKYWISSLCFSWILENNTKLKGLIYYSLLYTFFSCFSNSCDLVYLCFSLELCFQRCCMVSLDGTFLKSSMRPSIIHSSQPLGFCWLCLVFGNSLWYEILKIKIMGSFAPKYIYVSYLF